MDYESAFANICIISAREKGKFRARLWALRHLRSFSDQDLLAGVNRMSELVVPIGLGTLVGFLKIDIFGFRIAVWSTNLNRRPSKWLQRKL